MQKRLKNTDLANFKFDSVQYRFVLARQARTQYPGTISRVWITALGSRKREQISVA